MDKHHNRVANGFIAQGEWKLSTKCFWLQQVERSENQFVFAPSEILVCMVNELVRNYTKGNKQHGENINSTKHGLSPCCFTVNWTALTYPIDAKRHRECEGE